MGPRIVSISHGDVEALKRNLRIVLFFFRNVAYIFSFQTLIACSSGASSYLSIDLVFLELLKQRRLIFAKQSVEDSAEIESDLSKFGPRM